MEGAQGSAAGRGGKSPRRSECIAGAQLTWAGHHPDEPRGGMPAPTTAHWGQDSLGLDVRPHDRGGPHQDSVCFFVKWRGHLPSAKSVQRVLITREKFFSLSLILYLHDMMDKCMVVVMVVMVVVV